MTAALVTLGILTLAVAFVVSWRRASKRIDNALAGRFDDTRTADEHRAACARVWAAIEAERKASR